MKLIKLTRIVLVSGILLQSTACSYIKSLFPDKERDYQFRTEIAPLIIPEDLKTKGLASLPSRTPEQIAAAAVAAATVVEPASPAPVVAPAAPTETKPEPKPAGPGVSSLLIDQAKTQAARLVGRALTRQKLEVVERNIDKGYFYIKFDPNAFKPEDGELWHEVLFLFGEDPSNEKEYRITITELNKQSSEVTIQDETGNSLSNQVSNQLLKMIADGINQDPSATPPAAGDKPES